MGQQGLWCAPELSPRRDQARYFEQAKIVELCYLLGGQRFRPRLITGYRDLDVECLLLSHTGQCSAHRPTNVTISVMTIVSSDP